MNQQELYNKRADILSKISRYKMCFYQLWDYELLSLISNQRRAGTKSPISYNDIIIMADTETSKKRTDTTEYAKYKATYIRHIPKKDRDLNPYVPYNNHVVAWTISLRAYHRNIVTLWGRKPSEFIECLKTIQEHMAGDNTIVYFHNLAYDWTFLRQYILGEYGSPTKMLATKPHYPIFIAWDDKGLILRDSLILAQRSLEKWAKDLGVETKKAVGKWDYEKLRGQNEVFTRDELEYIEHDTLAGVECIDVTMQALHKHIYSMPYTATGIPREAIRKLGKLNRARDRFLRQVPTFQQYLKLLNVFHGGYTHGNRHLISVTLRLMEDGLIQAFDFSSSYPFVMLSEKYPCEAFTAIDSDHTLSEIVADREDRAYMFKLIALDVQLKSDSIVMPALQYSKCVEVVNPVLDNGRILKADYIEIYLTEMDAAVIIEQYNFAHHTCTEIEVAQKDYLPRWFTDYIYSLYEAKCKLKKAGGVDYALAKATLNSCFGMCVQRCVRGIISEDYVTGEYIEDQTITEEMYQQYVNNPNNILLYQHGVWVTAYAFYNLFQLQKCCSLPIYSDTDSCYGIGWDMDALNAYNEHCKEKLLANGYGPVIEDGREYWLGIAEHKDGEDDYTEFRVLGAKRYCGRCKDDGKLHLTLAGVPKKGVESLKDDIDNFRTGMIFDGPTSGKKMHTYLFNPCYIDEDGNETADSIDLSPCNYLLQAVNVVDWDELFTHDIELEIPEEAFENELLL